MGELTRLDETLTSLETIMRNLRKLTYPIGRIRSIYGELYVGKKLIDLDPQLGTKRECKSADIYLKKINKRVEVKACEKKMMTGHADWVWVFRQSQIEHKKFDYTVLLGFKEKSFDIEKVFILSDEDLKGLPLPRCGDIMTRESTGVFYYENFGCYMEDLKTKYIESYVEIEEELNKHPEKFEDRWDKLK